MTNPLRVAIYARVSTLDHAKANFMSVVHLSVREAASHLGVSRSVVHRWRLSQKGTENEPSTASMIQ